MKRAAINSVYVPKFFNNRELPEEEQVTVEMAVASISDRDKYSVVKIGKKKAVEVTNREAQAIKEKVSKIANYFDEAGKPISTGEELMADADKGARESIALALELWHRIMGHDAGEDLDEGED